jgi:ribosomal protein S18 acetylase RimI-like enzyme/ubiquinone/menaquinone biosynthesis C-methylase UbiE
VIRQRGLEPHDRPRIAALLESLEALSEDERAVAIELVDHRLDHPGSDDYRFILSFSAPEDGGPERFAGYLCYGRTPLTQSTFDLYWLCTSPDFARSGVARGLCAGLEAEIASEGGGLVRVETGSREGHGAAVHFYDAVGFTRTATIPGFYAPGDDLIIFTKRVRGGAESDAPALDEAALHDAAFGYRDYAAERDFLLACARRFGGREVRRVLAWSCGPGRHLKAFADVGVAGTGTDPSDAMIAYARRLAGARGAGPEIRFVRAALDERPGDADAQVDLSFVPLSTIHLLTTPEAVVRHLRCAAELLRPGGVHVIEATHPADLTPSGVSHTEWTEVRGDTTVDARFRIHLDRITPERVVPVTLEVLRTTGKKGAGAPARLKQEDRWFIPDLDGWRAIVAQVPELSLAAALGDFNVAVPFEHQAAWRLILVLARR